MLARSSTVDGESPIKAIVLTREHKAIYPQERARIQKVMPVYMVFFRGVSSF